MGTIAHKVQAFEKMTAQIDLPSKMQIWPSTKEQMILYTDNFGDSMAKTARLSMREGIPILLAMCGISSCEKPRVSALGPQDRFTFHQLCVARNKTEDEAAMICMSLALHIFRQLGFDFDWQERRDEMQAAG